MNKKLYAGISQILLGALVAVAPQTFAHVCAVKEMPMACHYTAQAALGHRHCDCGAWRRRAVRFRSDPVPALTLPMPCLAC